ncbi:MAG: hypothetical protein AB7O52_10680 [Planctomycetota bacterium]
MPPRRWHLRGLDPARVRFQDSMIACRYGTFRRHVGPSRTEVDPEGAEFMPAHGGLGTG